MNNQNIGHTLTSVSQQFPDRTGLICKQGNSFKKWTFKELEDMVQAFCHVLLKHKITKGSRVILMVKPSMEFVCLAFALFRTGAVVILIDPGMGYRNLLRCISSVKPDFFIGTPKAILFKTLFKRHFKTVKKTILIHHFSGFIKAAQKQLNQNHHLSLPETKANDQAAIIFTTGSTGPPKGVCYTHAIFQAQLNIIRDYYKIGPNDIDQPAFPLFALFSTGLGACAVIPDMDPAHPAKVDPKKFIRTIKEFGVTYSFGSPAIWNKVSQFCQAEQITLSSLKKVLMAGAPISGDLVKRVRDILPPDALVHTPYGATECLPATNIESREIISETWPETTVGQGVCVGLPLPGNTIRIIPISEKPLKKWHPKTTLPTNEIGEIVISGPVVTPAYDNNEVENKLAKIPDNNILWHRMGDVGYLDPRGRLWVCGRRSHRVQASDHTLFPLPCEAVFNRHPAVYRSALVGVGNPPEQTPVLIVELVDQKTKHDGLMADLREIANRFSHTAMIEHFLIHEEFPTDIRHNAKIFREKLAVWAAEKIS